MMKFTTTIKRTALDMKKEDLKRDGYFDEYKDTTDFWNKRIGKLQPPTEAVFLCGREVNRYKVTGVLMVPLVDVEDKYKPYLSRDKVWRVRCEGQ